MAELAVRQRLDLRDRVGREVVRVVAQAEVALPVAQVKQAAQVPPV